MWHYAIISWLWLSVFVWQSVHSLLKLWNISEILLKIHPKNWKIKPCFHFSKLKIKCINIFYTSLSLIVSSILFTTNCLSCLFSFSNLSQSFFDLVSLLCSSNFILHNVRFLFQTIFVFILPEVYRLPKINYLKPILSLIPNIIICLRTVSFDSRWATLEVKQEKFPWFGVISVAWSGGDDTFT